MLVQFATRPGRDDRPNEDFSGAFPDSAVLLDGSGGPSELPSGCSHGTPWYVRQLGARLLATMETDHDHKLADILADCITEVADLHKDVCDLDALGAPASMVVMVRAAGDEFEYLVLGDATLVVETKDGIQVVSDHRIDAVAAAEKLAMTTLPVGTPEHQEARIRFVRLQQSLRNCADGYWIASTDPGAAYEALTGSIPAEDIRRAALMSDGVTRFVEFDLGTWHELLAILDTHGPTAVFSRVRAAEAADPDGVRWPRAKKTDDVAVVHFTRQEKNAWGDPVA